VGNQLPTFECKHKDRDLQKPKIDDQDEVKLDEISCMLFSTKFTSTFIKGSTQDS